MANDLKVIKEETLEALSEKMKALEAKGEIRFPVNYSPENAMKSAWLILQEVKDKSGKPALEVCTKASIYNALYDMVIQGLSPAKKQCYFIVRGDNLYLDRSYFGTIAAAKRFSSVKNVVPNCIYEGDEFEYEINVETGIKKITKHKQSFENINIDKIKGVYAIVITEDYEDNYVEIMNMNQVRKAWNQGPMKGNSGAHKNFTDQMAMRTVINRACKMFVNTSDDSDLLVESFNRTTENEYKNDNNVEEDVKTEIEEKANKKTLGFEKEKVQDVKYEAVEPKEEAKTEPEGTEQVTMNDPGF